MCRVTVALKQIERKIFQWQVNMEPGRHDKLADPGRALKTIQDQTLSAFNLDLTSAGLFDFH